MQMLFFILTFSTILYPMICKQEYHQHRYRGLQTYPDVITQEKFEKLQKNSSNINQKNILSLLSFTHSIASLSQKSLYEFIQLLEQEHLKEKTIHTFTDVTIARIFLERKNKHLHIGTNQMGLSNVFTDAQRIQDLACNLYNLQDRPETYVKVIKKLYEIQQQIPNRHAELNFAIALSLANKNIRRKIRL